MFRGLQLIEELERACGQLRSVFTLLRFAGEELDLLQLCCREIEQSGFVGQRSRFEKRGGGLIPETFDIERTARSDVEQPFAQLRRTTPAVRTTKIDVTFLLRGQSRPALRTLRRHHELAFLAGAEFGNRTNDFRNHIAGFANHHHVAYENTLAFHFLLIVQRRHLDRGTTDLHGFHHRKRRRPTGATNTHADIQQTRGDFLRRVLVRDRPARCTRRSSKRLLHIPIVHLHNRTVDFMFDVVSVFCHIFDERDCIRD